MKPNVGTIDRAVRALIGLLLIVLPFVTGLGAVNAFVSYASVTLGAVLLLVALTRVCPFYAIFGLRTCG